MKICSSIVPKMSLYCLFFTNFAHYGWQFTNECSRSSLLMHLSKRRNRTCFVNYLIYAVMSQFQLCHYLHTFSAQFIFSDFLSSQIYCLFLVCILGSKISYPFFHMGELGWDYFTDHVQCRWGHFTFIPYIFRPTCPCLRG